MYNKGCSDEDTVWQVHCIILWLVTVPLNIWAKGRYTYAIKTPVDNTKVLLPVFIFILGIQKNVRVRVNYYNYYGLGFCSTLE